MWEAFLVAIVFGLLVISAVFLFQLTCPLSVWIDRRLNPEPAEGPEPIKRVTVGGGLYLIQGDKVLDVGRALSMRLTEGITNEPHVEILTWEGKRRLLASSPTVNMTIIRKALGADDGALPMLPGSGGDFLPALGEFKVEDENG